MRVQRLDWSNFRRMPDGAIDVRGNLVLVGPNDTGKTSLLRALHLCLGMSHSQLLPAISERDFTDTAEPLTLRVTLDGIEDPDRAAFPDEITVGPPEALVIELEASMDPADPDQRDVRRRCPDGGHGRSLSRLQLDQIGFEFVPAVRSLLRELGAARTGAVRTLLSGLDLAADEAALAAAADAIRAAIDGSTALGEFREGLAAALSEALPIAIGKEDIRVVSESEVLDEPLAGVTVTVADGGHAVPLAEQSDGIRALSVLALLGMSYKTARIIAVDEPETHLHPSAQRSIATSLVCGAGQRILATHSPAVVEQCDPLDVVVVRADRTTRQLPAGAPVAAPAKMVRHWSNRLLEPLTARAVLLVEGVSDRILVERTAALLDMNLHRVGVSVFELGGKGLFPTAYSFFGPAGFDIPLLGLLDEDARDEWAFEVGVAAADLEGAGFRVCGADLEEVYVDAIGPGSVIALLQSSPLVAEQSLLDVAGVADVNAIGRDELLVFCRHKKHKTSSALVVAAGMTPAHASMLQPVVELLGLAS